MDGRWKGTILWRLQDRPRRTTNQRSIPGSRALRPASSELVADASSKETTKTIRLRLLFTFPRMEGRSPVVK